MRYLRLVWRFFSICAARKMQYRAHFFGTTVSGLAHILLFLVFIETVLGQAHAVAAWDRPRMYLLYGTFVLVFGIAEFAIQPNIAALSESVRRGELDYVFIKPVDAQVFISLQHFHLPSLASVATGLLIIAYGLVQISASIDVVSLLTYALHVVCGVIILYSLWLLSSLFVFKAIRIDSIVYLFIPIAQFARYPIGAYPRLLQALFHFVAPLVFVATVPAEALLGLGTFNRVSAAVLAALLCLSAARIGWRIACRSYVSASS